ncbi:hypothetical protein UFOVP434_79 [uncultured Caudovirales phage]|uniref:Uncharacterized protein n=1 Tax=uncultured Caudovirales phage TaxID=2100421 RepID=A0A6J5MAF2_9CAUD|nr:hypothetical protein UFOVP434_79 [uncultured Caudovirales phage]
MKEWSDVMAFFAVKRTFRQDYFDSPVGNVFFGTDKEERRIYEDLHNLRKRKRYFVIY